MRYAVVIEKAGKTYSAYVPDLPGCVATGATASEAQREIGAAIQFHVEGLRENCMNVPKATATVEYVAA